MSSLYKKLFTQTLFYGLSSILPKLIHYFFIKFFTNELNLGEFSLYSDMYALSFIVISFLGFGLETAYFRFLYKKSHLDKEKIFSNGIFILFILASLFLIFSSLFSYSIAHFLHYEDHREYINFFLWIIFFEVMCSLPLAYLRSEGLVFRYGFIKIFSSLLFSVLILLIFYLYHHKNLNYLLNWLTSYTDKTGFIFFVNVITSLVNLFFLLPIFLKINFKKISISISSKMLSYGGSIMIGSLAFALNENLGKLFIRRIFSDKINGAYSACYKIAALMALHVNIFRLAVEPFFFKKSKTKEAKNIYAQTTYFFVLIGVILYVLLCSNLRFIAGFFIHSNYHEALKIIPIILMANLFLGIYTNLSISYKLMDKPYMGTLFSVLGLGITLLFNLLLFFPEVGFMFSAWGTLFSYSAMMLVSFFWGQKNYPIAYETKPLILHLLVATFVGYLLYNFVSSLFLNLSSQFIYLILVFYFERKKLSLLL